MSRSKRKVKKAIPGDGCWHCDHDKRVLKFRTLKGTCDILSELNEASGYWYTTVLSDGNVLYCGYGDIIATEEIHEEEWL